MSVLRFSRFNFLKFQVADQRYNETITLRILNPTYSTNEIDLMKMLKSVDLEGRGFQKEEFRKMLSTGNTNSSAYTTTLYYFKMVKCSGVMQIVTKLDKLFPGWSVRALFSAYDLFDLKFIIQLRSIDKQKKIHLRVHLNCFQ